jgi:hypothetical protein
VFVCFMCVILGAIGAIIGAPHDPSDGADGDGGGWCLINDARVTRASVSVTRLRGEAG